jgi:hypothetical protein
MTSIRWLNQQALILLHRESLAIAKLLNDQYFRLLDFYFHNLIQQRPYCLVLHY